MPLSLIIRTLIGLLLILVLGVGGFFRWQAVEHPIHVERPLGKSHGIQLAGKLTQRNLNTLPHTTLESWANIDRPLDQWDAGLTLSHVSMWGESMGTAFSVTLSDPVTASRLSVLVQEIERRLEEITRQMSTWEPESEIARFNQSDESGPFPVSDGFVFVVQRALALGEETGGAFDPTLNPLLNLWGFGNEGTELHVPSDTEIAAARKNTGRGKVWVDKDLNIWKAGPHVQLNLGALAKGYGVDVLAGILEAEGYENWFVEIGGEVVVKGLNPDVVPWKIGIQYPTTNPMDQRLQGILHMTRGAVATSGDYRNYIQEDSVLYSHILDPRSGRAALSATASVTVVAPSCMDADGMATALFVMGAEEGATWVEERPEVEAMFLVRGANGEVFEKFSSGFVASTGYIPEQ